MSLKRKIGSSSTLKQITSNHPSLNEVRRANRSSTRDHTDSYHDLLKSLDVRKDVNAPLLAWYGTRGDLPWRSDLSDEQIQSLSEEAKAQRAYEVWVSEIMLQQTQVATVIPYYQKWMAAFPTVTSLSEASIDSVNSLWKGLGYYSRASRLLDGAKTVVNTYGGKLPNDPEVLVKKIEGIGPYTAGAIASIAYGVQTPTVDGNIQRVICRLLAIYADMKKKSTTDYIWQVAEEMVPDSRAGHWNQALMDLGATVCTPKNPKCGECPLNNVCLAYAEASLRPPSSSKESDIEDMSASSPSSKKKGKAAACTLCLPLDPPSMEREVTLYPLKVVKKKSRDEDIAVCVVEWRSAEEDGESKVLLVKRPKTGLLAGLDEFPSVVMPDSDSSPSSRLSTSLELLAELLHLPPDFCIKAVRDFTALSVSLSTDLGSIKHIYSHINATFHCRHVVLVTPGSGGSSNPPKVRKENRERCKWIPKEEVDQANISTGAVKIWKLVTDGAAPVKVKGGSKKPKESKKKMEEEGQGQMKLSFTKKITAKPDEPEIEIVVSPRKKRRIDISSDEEG